MAFNKHWRNAWCVLRLAEAVKLFHEARVHLDNQHIELEVLARQCANTVFQENAGSIVGDKEACARQFMRMCGARFEDEIERVILESTVEEMVC